MVWWRAVMAGRLVLFLCKWKIREQQGWQRPCNETPPSPHWTWVVSRHGDRATEENRGKREEIEGQGQGAIGSERLID